MVTSNDIRQIQILLMSSIQNLSALMSYAAYDKGKAYSISQLLSRLSDLRFRLEQQGSSELPVLLDPTLISELNSVVAELMALPNEFKADRSTSQVPESALIELKNNTTKLAPYLELLKAA
jgi:hypothetical protein